MLIQCTKALLDRIDVPVGELLSPGDPGYSPDSLKAWHANMINIDRRKAIVLMNNITRYPVVIYRPKPKDFHRVKELIAEAVATALRMEGVRQDVISSYMTAAGEIRFSKTASRSMVAKMNNAIHETRYMGDYLDEGKLIQRYISIATSRLLQNAPDGDSFYPIEKMLESLAEYGNNAGKGGVLDVELYQLKVQIEMEGFDIWRRVLVPSTLSFRHLHHVIQTVFDWQDYHLHKFEAKKRGLKPKQIVMDDDPETLEWLDFDAYDVLQERFTALEDIFPTYRTVRYEYDFGDSWMHTITMEKTARASAFKALYLGGEGERPPEDVGGSWGYEEYKRIMADHTDPEYESMKMWAESQKERRLPLEKINDRLRHTLTRYFY